MQMMCTQLWIGLPCSDLSAVKELRGLSFECVECADYLNTGLTCGTALDYICKRSTLLPDLLTLPAEAFGNANGHEPA